MAGAAITMCSIGAADANGRDAAFIIDVNSGRTLYESKADAIRHPASLTKVMTLYLLFEKLDRGEITLSSRIPISANAAAEVPTKLGLKAGSSISVEDAIKALVVRSANDIATAIGEFVGGSEAQFTRMMTSKARQLGMPRTVYRNAHGLPNSAQVTTAREQAILGIAIQQRFPKYFHFFSTRSFKFAGRTVRGHNRLLGSVPGVNGIKTGYIRASGFNLITSMKRGDRQIVGVVLGGRTAAARDARMRSLISDHIMTASVKRTAPTVIAAAKAAIPVPAPVARPATAVAALPAPPTRPVSEPAIEDLVQVASAAPAATVVALAEAKPSTDKPAAKPLPKPRDVRAAKPAAKPSTEPAEPIRLASAGETPVRFESGGALQAPRLGSSDPIKPIIVRAISFNASTTGRAYARPAPRTKSDRIQTASAGPITIPQRDPAPAIGSEAAEPQAAEPVAEVPAQAAAAANAAVATAEPGDADQAKTASTGAAGGEPEKPAAPRSGWAIQVGAFVVETDARERLDEARTKAAERLKKADPYTERTDRGSRTYYRARFAGFEARSEAEEACRELKRNEIQCLALRI